MSRYISASGTPTARGKRALEIKLSHRVQGIKPSPTMAVTARAAELKAAGSDVIGLGAGEPDFDTPDHIKAAAVEAMNQGYTRYTAVDGLPSLKEAVARKFARDNALKYRPQQILVSCGAKHSIFNLTQALLNPGDEVIIPAPYWVSYPDMVVLAEAKPVIVTAVADAGFKMTAAQLAEAITERTRLVILNSPSNPTGVVYSRAELVALGEVLRAHSRVLCATDDIYEHLIWGGDPFANIANACPDLYDRTVVINGVSKAYAMTGWRIGYAAGPESLIKAMKTIQSQSTSNPTSIAQLAAQAALDGDQQFIADMVGTFHERHDYVVSRLNALPGVRCLPAQGAFYAFPDFGAAIAGLEGIDDDLGLAERLIEQAGVALVPGSAFGAPGHLRLSFATSTDNLRKALDRIEVFLGPRA